MEDYSKRLCQLCEMQQNIIIDDEGNEHAFYIDFKNPENFVKLVNLIYKCGINQPYDYQLATLSFEEDDYIEVEQHERFEDRYLEVLLYSLGKSYDTWDKTFSNKVKQMIRDTKWKI